MNRFNICKNQNYDKGFIHPVFDCVGMVSPRGNITRRLHETSLFFINNSHEVIAQSYYDETLPKSMEWTLMYLVFRGKA